MAQCQVVYMPEQIFWCKSQRCQRLLGRYEENSFFVIDTHTSSSSKDEPNNIKTLGVISRNTSALDKQSGPYLVFQSNPNMNIMMHDIQLVEPNSSVKSVQIILYNPEKVIHFPQYEQQDHKYEDYVNFIKLSMLLRERRVTTKSQCLRLMCNKLNFLRTWLTLLVSFVGKCVRPFMPVFRNSAISQHFKDWNRVFSEGQAFKRGHIWPILIDIFLGTGLIVLIHRVANPGQHITNITYEIVHQLRKLLEGLRGSPVGLKINGHLNDFLLNCFIYHVNLWGTFLEIVSPAVNYLFLTLSAFGVCGLTFQLAMLSDLLILITIHAHCFYIYAAVLYRIEVVGLKALWRVVLGRRKNVLKNDRVESHDYEKQQLFLATLFFASLLFLLPTVMVYYVVFATLRLGSYCVTYTLLIVRRKLLLFPVCPIVKWLLGTHISPENARMEFVESCKRLSTGTCKTSSISVIRMHFHSSLNWKKLKTVEFEDSYLTIGQFVKDLIAGEIKGFIHPKATVS